MSEFLDNALQKALARSSPPDGFAERMMASIPQRNKQRRAGWYAAVAAVLAIAIVFSGIEQRRRNEQQRARQTEQQVVFAIALAMRHFEHVNTQLKKSAPTIRVEEKRGGERL